MPFEASQGIVVPFGFSDGIVLLGKNVNSRGCATHILVQFDNRHELHTGENLLFIYLHLLFVMLRMAFYAC